MATNVGHAEVDVDLDVDRLVDQGRDAGQAAGEAYGEEFFRDANGRLRDARGRFVNESRKSGLLSGSAFGRGFQRGLNKAFGSGSSNPFSGLTSQAELQTNRILAMFVRLGPAIVAALAAAAAAGPAFAAGLPALASMAALIGVIALGWDQIAEAVHPLERMFVQLQKPIGRILSDGVRPLAKELAGDLLPVLREGLGAVAEATNNIITSFLRWADSAQTLGLIESLLTGVAPILELMGRAALLFADAFLQISVAALPAFEALTRFILEGAQAFNAWISGLAETGQLTRGISESMDVLLGLLSQFGQLFGSVLSLLGDLGPAGVAALTGLVNVLQFIIDRLRPVARLLSENTESVELFATALGGLIVIAGGLQILALILSGAVGALSFLAAAFTIAYQNSATFRDIVAHVADFFQTQFVPAIQSAVAWVQDTLVPALQTFAGFVEAEVLPVVQQMGSFFAVVGQNIAAFAAFIAPLAAFLGAQLAPAFRAVWEALVPLGEALGPVLKPLLILVGGGIIAALVALLGVLVGALYIAAAGFRVLTAIVNYYVAVARFLINVVKEAAQFIGGVFVAGVRLAIGIFNTAAGAVSNFIGFVRGLIGNVQDLIGWLTSIPGNIPNPITWVLTAIIGWLESIVGWLGDIPSSLPNPIDWALDGVLGLIADVVDLLASVPSSLPNPFAGWSIPDLDIPGTNDAPFADLGTNARGGIFDKPTLGWFGEAGKEVIVPITRPRRALQLMERSGAADIVRRNEGAGRGKTTNITIPTTVHVPAPDPDTLIHQWANRVTSRVIA